MPGYNGAYIFHDHIIRRDTVRRNEQKRLIIHFIQVSHLSPCNQGQCTLKICRRERLVHFEPGKVESLRMMLICGINSQYCSESSVEWSSLFLVRTTCDILETIG